jgi:hypothetical protein
MVGIDNLKQAISYIATQAQAAFRIDANNDGTIDLAESFAFGLQILPTLPGILPVMRDAGPEIVDIRGPEFDELVDHILATDFLPTERDKAEEFGKAVIFWLNMNRKFTEYTIGYFNGEEVDYNPLDGLV